jgi:hypothetical protein
MQPSLDATNLHQEKWIYASLAVRDGDRELKPAQVAFDRLLFTEPPHLVSGKVEIILRNGDSEQRRTAVVLPHDPEATRVPIRLLAA